MSTTNASGVYLLKKIFFYFLFDMHWCEDIRSSGTVFIDSCELPCVGARIEAGSSGRAASTLSYGAITPVLYVYF